MKPSSPAHGRIIQIEDADGKSHQGAIWGAWLGILALAAAVKVGLLVAGAFPFNSDEAIVGLMARHILQGRWPTFFYGQAYMGSLDATLVAGAFILLGQKVVAIRAVQLALYLGTVVTTIMLARRIVGPKPALLAGMLMAVPSVNLTLYTTISLGGYGEALLIGNLILITTLSIVESPDRRSFYFVWGLLSGLGLWAFGLTLIYVVPAAVVIAMLSISPKPESVWPKWLGRAVSILLGGIVGGLPWLAYAIRHGPGLLLQELTGSAIAGASPVGLLPAIGSHAFNLLVFGSTVALGLRPPWEIRWLAPVLIPVVTAFWFAVAYFGLRSLIPQARPGPGKILLAGVTATLCAGFVLSPFGADPSGRYFTPLAVPMAIFGAGLLAELGQRLGRWPVFILAACVFVFNLWGTVTLALRNPPGLTTQFNPNTLIDHSYDDALIEFLAERGESRGFTNYWVAYPLAFLSSEVAVFVPRLPYHPDLRYTPRDDRYEPYDQLVADSPRVAYITTGPEGLDNALEGYFTAAEVTYRVAEIGDYRVYYALSKPVPPPDFSVAAGERP